MKAAKKNKKLVVLLVVAVLLFASLAVFIFAQQRDCSGIACASGDNCVAPNDAAVNCEELRKNPTKTDWY